MTHTVITISITPSLKRKKMLTVNRHFKKALNFTYFKCSKEWGFFGFHIPPENQPLFRNIIKRRHSKRN